MKLFCRLKYLIAQIFAETDLKPSSLMRNVKMLDTLIECVIR